MLPDKKPTTTRETALAIRFNFHELSTVPNFAALDDILNPSKAEHKSPTRRRVPRRSGGNSLPLIGLRPAIRLSRQDALLMALTW